MPQTTLPRSEATRQKREDILAAALRCFEERGVVATSMEDIRTAAGVSVGSLYHHFPSKESIAAALYVSLINAYKKAVEEAVMTARTPRAWIRAAIEHHIQWSISNPAATRFLLAHREPEVRRLSLPEVATLNRALESRVQIWLEDQVAAGQIRRMPVDIYLSVVVGSAHSFVRRWMGGSNTTSPQNAIDALSDAAWRAVRADRRATHHRPSRQPHGST